jgi:tagatose 1,6-diphosphate aldolase
VRKLSLGKYYRLQKCSSPQGSLSVLAIDHRTSLLKVLNKQEKMGGEALLADFKIDIVHHVGGAADSILLDPEIGAPACIVGKDLINNKGLIIAIERSGYSGEPTLRENELLQTWNLNKTIRMGADAVKLLVYYHPDAKNASSTEQLISEVSKDCDHHEIPFFLEVLTYSLDPQFNTIPGDERRRVVVDTVKRLSTLGSDVLKVEFPVDIKTNSDQVYWADACRELTEASEIPWILLSASVDYETYCKQVAVACQQGSSGVAVGRAVWKEAIAINTRAERIEFLSSIAYQRMKDVNSFCQNNARPWTDYYKAPEITVKWHEKY